MYIFFEGFFSVDETIINYHDNSVYIVNLYTVSADSQ